MRKTFEINGNLAEANNGMNNYDLFERGVNKVLGLFHDSFGKELLNQIPIYVDNATENSGYTPIITPVLNEILIIKLNIDSKSDFAQIIYQFSHELSHAIFFNYYGLNKPKAIDREESICSAISLITIKELSFNDLPKYLKHIDKLEDMHYRDGIDVAKSCSFNLHKIKKLIINFEEYK